MKMKLFISIVAAMLSITMFAEDTPLVQAMKTRDKIEEIRGAIARRGVECQSFDEMPQAISQISYINEFLNGNGEYRGPIVLTKNFTTKAFQYLNGEFDLQLLGNTTIDTSQFAYSYGLKNIYAPNVTTINDSGFRYSNVQNAVFPNVVTLGSYSFADCPSLNTILDFPNLASFGAYCFQYTPITELKSKPLINIPNNGFLYSTSLTNVNISQSSCIFSVNCFKGCTKLKHILCPNSFTIDSGCFSYSGMTNATDFLQKMTSLSSPEIFRGCSDLKEVKSDSIILLTERYLFADSGIERVDFPALKTIWNGTYNYGDGNMFSNCKNLKYVNMPALESICTAGSVSYFQDELFYNCVSLEEIELPSLKSIGVQAGCGLLRPFKYCVNLRSARFPQLEFLKYMGSRSDGGFFGFCYSLVDIQMPALKIMHNSHGEYGIFVGDCYSLKKINLPNLNEMFHNRGFAYNCPALREIYMPSLTNIVNVGGYIYPTPSPGTGNKSLDSLFVNNPMLTDITLGVKAATLKAMTGFPGGAPDTCVFHCPADAPNDVTIVKRNGTWEIVNNGTYQLADYLEGTGTQYINTGYIHGTNTVVEMTFVLKPQAIPSYQVIFGSRNNSNTSKAYALYTTYESLNQFAYVRNQVVKGSQYELNDETVFKVVCSNNTCKIYNQFDELLQQISTTAVVDQGVGPLALFTFNQSTTAGGFSPHTRNAVKNMKLLRFTLKEDGEVVQDLLPGVRSDGVGCLLDAANNWHPLFNCGTGNFNYGSITNSIPTGN